MFDISNIIDSLRLGAELLVAGLATLGLQHKKCDHKEIVQ